MPKRASDPPEWEALLSSAARLQSIVKGAVMVGGSASAMHMRHRLSADHDHVVGNLRDRYEQVLRDLESAAGWKTARINPPVQILGSLDGIQTGVRQLIRSEPLETQSVPVGGTSVTVPTLAETFRIKGFLILARNATRDYVDFAALGDGMGKQAACCAMERFDALYPQESGESALQQLISQTASPQPHDLSRVHFSAYKGLAPKWGQWEAIDRACRSLSNDLFSGLRKTARRRRGGPSP